MAANVFLRPDIKRWLENPFIASVVATIISLAIAFVIVIVPALLLAGANSSNRISTPGAGRTAQVSLSDGLGSATYLGNGYYLTARHVVAGQKNISIKIDTGKTFPASILWQSGDYDIALMRVSSHLFQTAAHIDCGPLRPGESVHLEGSPFGIKFVRTYGRVAATLQNADKKWAEIAPASVGAHWKSAVVVDATVLPGMSGGGVFDNDEDLVGVTVGVVATNQAPTGLGIVVPASAVCMLLARGAA